MDIRPDDLTGAAIRDLLQEHLRSMAAQSPPESMHALDLSGLLHPSVSFWTLWDGDTLLGCGALKELGPQHAEIKSMRTASTQLRRGVASTLLNFLIDEATRRGYRWLSLETGSMAGFEPARRLYRKMGFEYCAPFAPYVEDPNSVFMQRTIGPAPG